MVNEKAKYHWGRWIKDRAKVVGFLRDSDFAGTIGCSRQQLTNWFSFAAPPAQMRKGFDAALIAALKTDRITLFGSFKAVSPFDAPLVVSASRDEIDRAEATRRRVLAIVELMPNDGLKELARVGEQLLRGGMLQVA